MYCVLSLAKLLLTASLFRMFWLFSWLDFVVSWAVALFIIAFYVGAKKRAKTVDSLLALLRY